MKQIEIKAIIQTESELLVLISITQNAIMQIMNKHLLINMTRAVPIQ